MITQDKKIANHLIYIFSNLGEFFGAKKPPNYNKSASESAPFHFQHITVKQCFDIVQKINLYVINGHYVAKKSECKYLGLILDSSLSFHAQIKTILQKWHKELKL